MAAENITVSNKATHTATSVAGRELSLSALSVVTIPLPHTQVKSLARSGSDLVVTTVAGQTIVVHGFFVDNPDGHNSLVFKDKGGLWLSDLSSFDALPLDGSLNPADGGVFLPIDSTHPLLDPRITTATGPDTDGAATETIAIGAATDAAAATPAPDTGVAGLDAPGLTSGDSGALHWLPVVAAVGGFATALGSSNGHHDTPATTPATTTTTTTPEAPLTATMDEDTAHGVLGGTLSRPLAAGETLEISLDGGQSWNTVTEFNGTTWSYSDAGHALPDGMYVLQLCVVDPAGAAAGLLAVQQIEISASGTLNLSLQDVLSSASALADAGSTQPVMVDSRGGVSEVHLNEGVGAGEGQWQDSGTTTTVNGLTYEVYHNAAVDLLIQQGIAVS